jgi:hypothetical protein
MSITYFSAEVASQIIKNGRGEILCKIDRKEFRVNWINCNNKTFSAERKGSGGYQEFERFKEEIENDKFFYKRYLN